MLSLKEVIINMNLRYAKDNGLPLLQLPFYHADFNLIIQRNQICTIKFVTIRGAGKGRVRGKKKHRFCADVAAVLLKAQTTVVCRLKYHCRDWNDFQQKRREHRLPLCLSSVVALALHR